MNKTALISAFFSGAASIGVLTPKTVSIPEVQQLPQAPSVWEDVGGCFAEAWEEVSEASEAFVNG